ADPYPALDSLQSPFEPALIELAKTFAHRRGRFDRLPFLLRQVQGRPENDDNGITDEIVDIAAERSDSLAHFRQVFVQESHRFVRARLFDHRGKAADIRKQHAHATGLSA